MPYAPCPMPYAVRVPNMRDRKAIYQPSKITAALGKSQIST